MGDERRNQSEGRDRGAREIEPQIREDPELEQSNA